MQSHGQIRSDCYVDRNRDLDRSLRKHRPLRLRESVDRQPGDARRIRCGLNPPRGPQDVAKRLALKSQQEFILIGHTTEKHGSRQAGFGSHRKRLANGQLHGALGDGRPVGVKGHEPFVKPHTQLVRALRRDEQLHVGETRCAQLAFRRLDADPRNVGADLERQRLRRNVRHLVDRTFTVGNVVGSTPDSPRFHRRKRRHEQRFDHPLRNAETRRRNSRRRGSLRPDRYAQ